MVSNGPMNFLNKINGLVFYSSNLLFSKLVILNKLYMNYVEYAMYGLQCKMVSTLLISKSPSELVSKSPSEWVSKSPSE